MYQQKQILIRFVLISRYFGIWTHSEDRFVNSAVIHVAAKNVYFVH